MLEVISGLMAAGWVIFLGDWMCAESLDAGCGAWRYSIAAPPESSEDGVTVVKRSVPAKCYKRKAKDSCKICDAQPWIAHGKSDMFL